MEINEEQKEEIIDALQKLKTNNPDLSIEDILNAMKYFSKEINTAITFNLKLSVECNCGYILEEFSQKMIDDISLNKMICISCSFPYCQNQVETFLDKIKHLCSGHPNIDVLAHIDGKLEDVKYKLIRSF